MSLQKYQEHTQDASLDAVVDLLQHTSEMVSLFNDRLYICSTEDNRLHRLNEFHQWISQWAKATENQKHHFISTKLHFDLQSMCLGFQSMVHFKLLKDKNAVIKPAIVNQDCVENHFCQVRNVMAKMIIPSPSEAVSVSSDFRIALSSSICFFFSGSDR